MCLAHKIIFLPSSFRSSAAVDSASSLSLSHSYLFVCDAQLLLDENQNETKETAFVFMMVIFLFQASLSQIFSTLLFLSYSRLFTLFSLSLSCPQTKILSAICYRCLLFTGSWMVIVFIFLSTPQYLYYMYTNLYEQSFSLSCSANNKVLCAGSSLLLSLLLLILTFSSRVAFRYTHTHTYILFTLYGSIF